MLERLQIYASSLNSVWHGCVCARLATQSCSTLCDRMEWGPGSSVRGDSPGKNTEVGCHFLLQRIFPTQGLNPGLPHCRQMLYHLSHQGILHTKCHTMKSQWLCLPFFRSYAGTLVPRWLSGKKSTCQSKKCRRHPLDSWVGKIPWRRKWQSTTIFLPRKSCGQKSRMGYSP